MEKKKILISVNQNLYELIKENAKIMEWSINREITEMLYLSLEARGNYTKKIKATREALRQDGLLAKQYNKKIEEKKELLHSSEDEIKLNELLETLK